MLRISKQTSARSACVFAGRCVILWITEMDLPSLHLHRDCTMSVTEASGEISCFCFRNLDPCPGSIPGAGHLFRYVTNQPPKANSAFHFSGVGKWVPASAGKAKAGMVHSVSRWTRGEQVKLWDPWPWERVPYLSTLEVWSRQSAIQYTFTLALPLKLGLLVASWRKRLNAPLEH